MEESWRNVPAVLPIFSWWKKNIGVRQHDFIVREIRRRNSRRERILRPFHGSLGEKNWRGPRLIVIDWQNVECLLCLHVSPGAVEVSGYPPYSSRFGAFTLGRFRAYWEYNTFSPSAFILHPTQVADPVSQRVSRRYCFKAEICPPRAVNREKIPRDGRWLRSPSRRVKEKWNGSRVYGKYPSDFYPSSVENLFIAGRVFTPYVRSSDDRAQV